MLMQDSKAFDGVPTIKIDATITANSQLGSPLLNIEMQA